MTNLESYRGNPLLANECLHELDCQDIIGKISRCFAMFGMRRTHHRPDIFVSDLEGVWKIL